MIVPASETSWQLRNTTQHSTILRSVYLRLFNFRNRAAEVGQADECRVDERLDLRRRLGAKGVRQQLHGRVCRDAELQDSYAGNADSV